MEKKTIWFAMFRNVVPADFEHLLESLALKGWNIDKIGQFSSMKMDFIQSEPKKYRYVFDLHAFPKKDYKEIYEQFGWEFVGQMSNCFVWRKEYNDQRPESFSDLESLMKRNKRVRNAVAACFVLLLAAIAAILIGIGLSIYNDKGEKVVELVLELLFISFIASYLGWVVKKINRNIER